MTYTQTSISIGSSYWASTI